jgi:hypothetical protein
MSNLTFAGLRDGSLTAQGAVQGTGIGSGQNHGCTSLRFVNGTFRATSGQSGGTGIGSRYPKSGNSTVSAVNIFAVLALEILGGRFPIDLRPSPAIQPTLNNPRFQSRTRIME